MGRPGFPTLFNGYNFLFSITFDPTVTLTIYWAQNSGGDSGGETHKRKKIIIKTFHLIFTFNFKARNTPTNQRLHKVQNLSEL